MSLTVSAVLFLAIPWFVVSCAESATTAPTSPRDAPAFVRAALRDTAVIELRDRARLLEDGRVTVTVRALCPVGFQVIEGPLTLNQGTLPNDFFGEGFFTTHCTGHWHWQRVLVFTANEGGFQPGAANASGSLMVENPATGEFLQADDIEVLTIR